MLSRDWVKATVNGVEVASTHFDLNYFKYAHGCEANGDWSDYTLCPRENHYAGMKIIAQDSLQEQERCIWVLRKEDLPKAFAVFAEFTNVYISPDKDSVAVKLLEYYVTLPEA